MTATILGARGWDCGHTMFNDVDRYPSGNVLVRTSPVHTGTYSLYIENSWARIAVDGDPSNPSVSIWVILNSAAYNNYAPRIRWLLTTGHYVDLVWNKTTHTFDAYVDESKVAAGTIEVSNNTWFHVQCYMTIADSGSIGVKIDGHQSINYSGDTQPGGAAGASYLYLYNLTANGVTVNWDDLAWGYGDYLGDLRCVDIRPDADTAQKQWTPSTGTDNYATLDETPPSDADYNEASVNGYADELSLGDYDSVDRTPVAVVAWVRARMSDGTGDHIRVGIDSAGVDDDTEYPLAAAWEYYTHIADANPADAAAWEDADIDALKLRYEAVVS